MSKRLASAYWSKTVAVRELPVSEGGSIEGSVEATNVVLNGTMRGDIRAAGRVVLGPRAVVFGNVQYGVIESALGAQISGVLLPGGVTAPAVAVGSQAPTEAARAAPATPEQPS